MSENNVLTMEGIIIAAAKADGSLPETMNPADMADLRHTATMLVGAMESLGYEVVRMVPIPQDAERVRDLRALATSLGQAGRRDEAAEVADAADRLSRLASDLERLDMERADALAEAATLRHRLRGFRKNRKKRRHERAQARQETVHA